MGFDPEIEEILNSIKNKEKTVEQKTTPIDLPPPKPREEFSFTEIPAQSQETVEEPVQREEKAEESEAFEISEQPVFEAAPAVSKPPESKPEKSRRTYRVPVILGALVLVAAIGLGVFFLTQNLYVRKYEKKYNMTFPAGIPEEFCDLYGKNPTLAGSIVIDDYKSETPVYSEPEGSAALFEKGSDVSTPQHYRAAALSVSDADLEALYKDGDSFTSSSQTFTFKTVYGTKEKYQVIAAYYINTKPEDDNGYVFPYNCYGNFTEKSYKHYQDTIKCRSLYSTGYKIARDDYCLTLSVPTNVMPDFRFAIVGVKVDKVNKITETKKNPLLHYPQAYCDKLGIHNIYSTFFSKWYPEIVNSDGKTVQLTEKDFN